MFFSINIVDVAVMLRLVFSRRCLELFIFFKISLRQLLQEDVLTGWFVFLVKL